jgi:hypothetical protein
MEKNGKLMNGCPQKCRINGSNYKDHLLAVKDTPNLTLVPFFRGHGCAEHGSICTKLHTPDEGMKSIGLFSAGKEENDGFALSSQWFLRSVFVGICREMRFSILGFLHAEGCFREKNLSSIKKN